MTSEPVVIHASEVEWETWRQDQIASRGHVEWKTLISAGLTESNALTVGLARIPPGGALRTHRHDQAEAYLILAGSGTVTVEGSRRAVLAGTSVFIPGGASHSIESTDGGELRFAYVLDADSFEDVQYEFDG